MRAHEFKLNKLNRSPKQPKLPRIGFVWSGRADSGSLEIPWATQQTNSEVQVPSSKLGLFVLGDDPDEGGWATGERLGAWLAEARTKIGFVCSGPPILLLLRTFAPYSRYSDCGGLWTLGVSAPNPKIRIPSCRFRNGFVWQILLKVQFGQALWQKRSKLSCSEAGPDLSNAATVGLRNSPGQAVCMVSGRLTT